MKNQSQVRERRSKNSPASQASRSAVSAKPRTKPDNVTVILQSPSGEEHGRFELPRPFYAAIKRCCRERGCTFEGFINAAFRSLIRRSAKGGEGL